MDLQCTELERTLKGMSNKDIAMFDGFFASLVAKAYRYDLWDCAFMIGGGCSDDAFTDFRSWMISMGREAFYEMLANADQVGKFAKAPGVEDIFAGNFRFVAVSVYGEATGRDRIPERFYDSQSDDEPLGDRLDPDDADAFKAQFPMTWEIARCTVSWPDEQPSLPRGRRKRRY